MSLVFLSLPLFPLSLVLSLLLLFLLIDDSAVLVQDAIRGPLDVSKQIAVDQLLAIRLQDMVGCPVIMGIGIDRVDGPSHRSGAPVLVAHHPLDDPLLGVASDILWWAPWHGGAEATHPQTRPVRPAALSHSDCQTTVRRTSQ